MNLTKKNRRGLNLSERKVLNLILHHYKDILRKPYVEQQSFKMGISWLYEKLFKLPVPQIFYTNSLDFVAEIDEKSKPIQQVQVTEALYHNVYVPIMADIKKSNLRIDKDFVRNELSVPLRIERHRTVADILNGYRKYGINSITEWSKIAYMDFHLQLGYFSLPDFSYLKSLYCSGAYHIFLWEDFVMALAPPIIRENEQGLLHSVLHPAVEWYGGPKVYYLNGREMPEWIYTVYGTEAYYDLFIRQKDEDIKAGVVTKVKAMEGNTGLMKFLKAELIDEKEIQHFSGYREILRLYKTKETFQFLQDRYGKFGQPYCWSEFVCPSTGSTYLIDNSADFTDAVEAAKFLRPRFIPQTFPYRWSYDAS